MQVPCCYAFPSFYARGIANARPPALGKMPAAPPMRRPDAPRSSATAATTWLAALAAGRAGAADVWEILQSAGTGHLSARPAVLNGDGSAGGEGYPQAASYAGMLARTQALATALRGTCKLGEGSVVGILMPNRAEVMELQYALAGLRAVTLNLNYRLAAAELAYVLHDAGADYVAADPRFAASLTQAVAACNDPCPDPPPGRRRIVRGVLWVDEGVAVPTGEPVELGARAPFAVPTGT